MKIILNIANYDILFNKEIYSRYFIDFEIVKID